MKLVPLLVALAVSPLFAQPAEVKPQVNDAIALMNADKFDDAIAMLDKIRKDDPSNDRATYMLAIAVSVKGDSKRCRDLLEPLAEKPGRMQDVSLGVLAKCLSDLGETDKAVDAYRRGLALDPTSKQMGYNLGVLLVRRNSLDEAREVLERETRAHADDASAHILLAETFEKTNFTIPALASYLRFLALAPATDRTSEVLGHVTKLLDGAASPGRKEEGDYDKIGQAIATTPVIGKTEFERRMNRMVSAIRTFVELSGDHTDYTAAVQRPFFVEMDRQKFLPAFAATALLALNVDGADRWLQSHTGDLAKYTHWLVQQTTR